MITGSVYADLLIGLIPILWILFSMLRLKMPPHSACPVALIAGIMLAVLVWKMPVSMMPGAVAEGVMLGMFPIIWVVFGAISLFNITVRSGSMQLIKQMLTGFSDDRRVQVLIIAFAFGGFLEAAAGFGTAVAIPVAMLIAIGFEPVFAIVVCLAANTIPVAFGVAGIPVITLAAVTGLPLGELTIYTALQLLPFVVVLPLLLVLLVTKKLGGLKGVVMLSISSGIAFGAGQTIVAWLIGPELAAFAGSLLSLSLILAWCGLKRTTVSGIRPMDALRAWSPYIMILAAILTTRLVPGLMFLGKLPFIFEYMLYTGPGAKPSAFALLTNPGTILLISAAAGGFIQGLGFKAIAATAFATLKQISRTVITVLSIVSLAKVMGYSGMIGSLAGGITLLTGRLYPLFSPFIGAFGTFLTGSDTSSNVLFGELQKQAASTLHVDPSWLAAANASGAAAGKMISPQSIAIASSATGLKGFDHIILSKTLKYSFVFVIAIGILIFAFNP